MKPTDVVSCRSCDEVYSIQAKLGNEYAMRTGTSADQLCNGDTYVCLVCQPSAPALFPALREAGLLEEAVQMPPSRAPRVRSAAAVAVSVPSQQQDPETPRPRRVRRAGPVAIVPPSQIQTVAVESGEGGETCCEHTLQWETITLNVYCGTSEKRITRAYHLRVERLSVAPFVPKKSSRILPPVQIPIVPMGGQARWVGELEDAPEDSYSVEDTMFWDIMLEATQLGV